MKKYAFAASLFSEKNNLLNISVRNMLELVAIHFITNFQGYWFGLVCGSVGEDLQS